MRNLTNVRVLLVVFFATFSLCRTATIEHFLEDPLFVRKKIDCVLGRGPCDALGKSLKDALVEVIVNDCGHCNPHQIQNALKIVDYMEKNHQKEWEEIVLRYQPSSVQRRYF